MKSWLKDLIWCGGSGKMAVSRSCHHTWVMFGEPWPAIRALSQLLLHGHWLPIPSANYSMGWNLGLRIWFGVALERSWLFGDLASTHGSCLLGPGWLYNPWAIFCCMGIGCQYQGVSIAWSGILAQRFDLGWSRREVSCLEFWVPHKGHVPGNLADYPRLEPTFAAWALVAHTKG